MATKQSATLLCAAIDKDGEPYTTQIVAFISPGLPYFSIIGMPDTFLGGVRERIHTAMGAQGFAWPATRVTANIMPASRHKDGRQHPVRQRCPGQSAVRPCGPDRPPRRRWRLA